MRRLLILGVLLVSACNSVPNPSPLEPAPPTPTPVVSVASIRIIVMPAAARAGEPVTVSVFSLGDEYGYRGAPNTTVSLRSSTGTLRDTHLTTDTSAFAQTQWTGEESGEIIAVSGDITGKATVQVIPADVIPPPRPPAPPTTPIPPAPPGPAPIPTLGLTVTTDARQVPVNGVTTVRAFVEGLQAGETVLAYQWDFQDDGAIDATTLYSARDVQFTRPGIITTSVSILTSLDRRVEGTAALVVYQPVTR